MPRPNPSRGVLAERRLAQRISHERQRPDRSWSYEGLAKRMTDAGCPINQSAIYKIENADPPRRITVDELVAFSTVFEIPVAQLLLPPEVAASRELAALLVEWEEATLAQLEAERRANDIQRRVNAYVKRHPEIEPVLRDVVGEWGEHIDSPYGIGMVTTLWLNLSGGDEPSREIAALGWMTLGMKEELFKHLAADLGYALEGDNDG